MLLRVDLLAEASAARPQQCAPELRPCRGHRCVADSAEHGLRYPLHQLQRDVAGEARRSRSHQPHRLTTSSPSTLPMNSNVTSVPGRRASSSWDSTTRALPRAGSSPFDRSPMRGCSTPSTTLASAAPMNANCTMCSRLHSALAPTSSRWSPDVWGTGKARDRQRRAVDALRALDVEQPRGQRRTRAARAHQRLSSPLRDCPAAITIDAPGADRIALTGSLAFAIDTGASTTSTPSGRVGGAGGILI